MTNPATTRQKGMLHGQLGKLGFTERADKLRILSALLYRNVESTNDLSRDEAHAAIDVLVNVAGQDDPTGYLARLIGAYTDGEPV
jgi:hypothetical protein